MKVIFLDIDGVLNCLEDRVALGALGIEVPMHAVDKCKVGLVAWLCELTGAKVVISSTWRILFDVDWFKGFFEGNGWIDPPIIDKTIKCSSFRGDEVQEWVDKINKPTDEEFKYVILDDDSDFHDTQPLVLCDGTFGFTLREVVKAYDMLGPAEGVDVRKIEDLRSRVDPKRKYS